MPLFVPYFAQAQTATIVIDGVTYRVPVVDSDGHVQVDVLTSALPSGGATSARQDTMITALQLIDDLRGALDAVQDDRLNVNVYQDGASEVKSIVYNTVSDATVRATVITPTSDKRIRVISVGIHSESSTLVRFEVYFGTGANITTDTSKVIAMADLQTTVEDNLFTVWPDGGGPLGAVDEVLSARTHLDVAVGGWFVVHYREE